MCPICGRGLVETEGERSCFFCGASEETEWVCPEGHYQCEDCRLAGPAEIIERVCAVAQETDPVEIADRILLHPSFHAYGQEHHLLVAPVLLTALRNAGRMEVAPEKIQAALQRTAEIPIAVCASRGDCGAAVGVGCALSLVTGATIRSGRERSLALLGTARALERLAGMQAPAAASRASMRPSRPVAACCRKSWRWRCRLTPSSAASPIHCRSARENPVSTIPSWRLLQDDIREPFLHFAVEEAVLRGIDEGSSPPTLRLRRSQPSVWIGIYQTPEEDVDLDYCGRAPPAHRPPLQPGRGGLSGRGGLLLLPFLLQG